MRISLSAITAICLVSGAALACDDHTGTCKIEDWRWSGPTGGYLSIEGVATCDTGRIRLRLYEGENGKFLGVASGRIRGHTFRAIATDVKSASVVAIKYSIEPR